MAGKKKKLTPQQELAIKKSTLATEGENRNLGPFDSQYTQENQDVLNWAKNQQQVKDANFFPDPYPSSTEQVFTGTTVVTKQKPFYGPTTKLEKRAQKVLSSGSWADLDPKLRREAMRTVFSLEGQDLPWSEAFVQYPDLALAAAKATGNGELSREQLKTIVNVVNIVDSTVKVMSFYSDEAKLNELKKYSPRQLMAMGIFSEELIKWLQNNALTEATRATQEAATTGGKIKGALGNIAGWGIDGLNWINENAQHLYRTVSDNPSNIFAAVGPGEVSWSELQKSWEDTDTGQIDKTKFKKLQQEYGAKTVSVILEAVQAMNSKDDNAFGKLGKKYADDQEALNIIDQILFESERTPKIAELIGRVDTVRKDDWGNMTANAILPDDMEGTSFAYTAIDKTTNFVGVFLLDPTLVAGKFMKSYKIFKYGLMRNLGVGNLAQALSNPKVLREFDSIADFVNRMSKAAPVERANIRRETAIAHGKYFTDDAIKSLEDYRYSIDPLHVLTKDDVADWAMYGDSISNLLVGQSAIRVPLIPHMSKFRLARIKARLATRRALDLNKESNKIAQDIFGSLATSAELTAIQRMIFEPGINYTDDQAVKRLFNFLDNEQNQILIATEFGIDPNTLKLQTIGKRTGLPASGKYSHRLTIRGMFNPDQLRISADRFLRNFAKMPTGRSVAIDSPEDANLIRDWVRIFAPAHFADIVKEIWIVSTPAQRRGILGGLNETMLKAKGAYATTIEQAKAIEAAATTGFKYGEQYAVTQAVTGRLVDEVEALGENSYRANRKFLDYFGETDDAVARKVKDINIRLSQLINRRREIQTELKALSFDAGGSATQLKQDVKNLQRVENAGANTERLGALQDEFDRIANDINYLIKDSESVIKPFVRYTKYDVKDVQKQVKSIQRQLDSDIASLEDSLKRLAGADASNLAAKLSKLKAQRAILNKERSMDWFEAQKLLALREEVKSGGSAILYNPAEYNGEQHALHLWQSANRITLPDYDAIQNLSARVGILNKILGLTWNSEGALSAGNLTSLWSMGNLWGPRYVQRAATEDIAGFWASNGKFFDLIKGTKAARIFRDVRGMKLGLPTRVARALADRNRIASRYILRNLDPKEVLAARTAAMTGDMDQMQFLMAKALGRDSVKKAGLKFDAESEEALIYLAQSNRASGLVNKVAEISHDLNSGKIVDNADNFVPYGSVRVDLREQYAGTSVKGPYTNIAMNSKDPRTYDIWEHNLHGILHRDGAIGQAVFNALRGSQTVLEARKRAIDKIVDILYGENAAMYYDELTILNKPEMTPSKFAARYFDDSAQYFALPSGSVNKELIAKLTRTNPETGAKFGALYTKGEGGERLNEITSWDLVRDFPAGKRPEQVLGRESTGIIAVAPDPSLINQLWQPLSDSLARITREPIFMANYLKEWKGNQPLIAKWVEKGFEEDTAKSMLAELSMRRAEELAIAYMDNPRVRSLLAFNVRNVSRYYRATEDFYRRVLRLAKYNPEAIQKLNLGYQVVDHSGFTWRDENGDQYFIYPGSNVVADAWMSVTNMIFGPNRTSFTPSPFGFTGKTLMLTPSADPDSWNPTFAGPAAFPLKLITSFDPFQSLESALLGSRSEQPTGDAITLSNELVFSMLPSHFLRVLSLIPGDERSSQYGSALKSAAQMMVYNGQVKEGMSVDEARDIASKQAYGILGLRVALGFILPASPTIVANENITNEARMLGIRSLRSGYIKLLNQFKGDIDKATLTWFNINPKLMPFKVGMTEASGQAYPSMTAKSAEWMRHNQDLMKNHRQASVFFMPAGADFSFDSYKLAKANGFIRGKEFDEYFRDVVTAKDYFIYTKAKEQYDNEYAATISPYERNQLKTRWEQTQQILFANNPFLETRKNAMSVKSNIGLKKETLLDIREALQEIDRKDPKAFNRNIKTIELMLKVYDTAMADIEVYQGASTYAEIMRRDKRQQLRDSLIAIAGENTNAKNLYNNVLDSLIGGKPND